MTINELGVVIKDCTIKWTRSSKECYKNGLMCYKCRTLPNDLKSECKMKPVVLELVRLYGRPKEKWEEPKN